MYIVDPKFTKLIYDTNELKNKAAKIIVERDSLIYHVCKNLKIDYMLKIGSLEYKLFKIQNEVLSLKTKIEMVRDKLKNKEKVDYEDIENKVKLEFSEFDKIEKNMLEDIDIAIDLSMSDVLDLENLEKINDIYLTLQKMYNPVLNINIKEEYTDILKKIEKYYRFGNIKKLENMLKEIKDEMLVDEVENLEKLRKRFEEIINENIVIIAKIKKSFPYNQKTLLESEALIRRKKNEINDLIYFNEIKLENLKKEMENLKNNI